MKFALNSDAGQISLNPGSPTLVMIGTSKASVAVDAGHDQVFAFGDNTINPLAMQAGSLNVYFAGTLKIESPGPMVGTGTFAINGGNTVTIDGAGHLEGSISINDGTLILGSVQFLGSPSNLSGLNVNFSSSYITPHGGYIYPFSGAGGVVEIEHGLPVGQLIGATYAQLAGTTTLDFAVPGHVGQVQAVQLSVQLSSAFSVSAWDAVQTASHAVIIEPNRPDLAAPSGGALVHFAG